MKIDFHVHYRGDDGHVEERLEEIQGLGVVTMVVFGNNEACEKLAQAHPDLIVPFVHWRWESDTPASVREYADRGFRGVKFIHPRHPYNAEEYFPIYEAVQEAGLIGLFHSAVQIETRPGLFDQIQRNFRDFIIVGAHIGYPWYLEACAMMRWCRNVYFDTSTSQLTATRPPHLSEGPEEFVKPYIRDLYLAGDLQPEKLLWGSDTFLGRERAVEVVEYSIRQHDVAFGDLKATDEVRENIYFNTAHRLLAGSEPA